MLPESIPALQKIWPSEINTRDKLAELQTGCAGFVWPHNIDDF
jgi:hypothetical protein